MVHDFKIPDWRIYKVAGVKQLENHERLLAAKGLKDPWIRNEAWRYGPGMRMHVWYAMARQLGRGLKWAAPAMLITVAIDVFWHEVNPRSTLPNSSHKEDGHH